MVKRLLRTKVKLISFSLFLLNHSMFCLGILNFNVISCSPFMKKSGSENNWNIYILCPLCGLLSFSLNFLLSLFKIIVWSQYSTFPDQIRQVLLILVEIYYLQDQLVFRVRKKQIRIILFNSLNVFLFLSSLLSQWRALVRRRSMAKGFWRGVCNMHVQKRWYCKLHQNAGKLSIRSETNKNAFT